MASTLIRPRDGRIIAGVCAGLARRFGWSVFVIRLLFLLSFVLPGIPGDRLPDPVDPDAERARLPGRPLSRTTPGLDRVIVVWHDVGRDGPDQRGAA